MTTIRTSVIGFDSAWTDNPKAPGAVCAIRVAGACPKAFVEPELASFRQALEFIERECVQSDRCLVALDQPTIVPNPTGCRPVDRIAGSLISWLGGGVQPANRSRIGMFDDAAPVWRFKEKLGAVEDPEAARSAASGLFLMEVFPAMALPTLEAAYFGYRLGPRYNPARGKTFKLEHWRGVLAAVARFAAIEQLAGLSAWVEKARAVSIPRKADQDRLDAVICALVGYRWLTKPREHSILIGDLESGYMIAPASTDVRERLRMAAARCGVPVDGKVPT